MKQGKSKSNKASSSVAGEKGAPKEHTAYKQQEQAYKTAGNVKDGFPIGHPDKLKTAEINKGNRSRKR